MITCKCCNSNNPIRGMSQNDNQVREKEQKKMCLDCDCALYTSIVKYPVRRIYSRFCIRVKCAHCRLPNSLATFDSRIDQNRISNPFSIRYCNVSSIDYSKLYIHNLNSLLLRYLVGTNRHLILFSFWTIDKNNSKAEKQCRQGIKQQCIEILPRFGKQIQL